MIEREGRRHWNIWVGGELQADSRKCKGRRGHRRGGRGLECLISKEAAVMKTKPGLIEGLGTLRELWTLL